MKNENTFGINPDMEVYLPPDKKNKPDVPLEEYIKPQDKWSNMLPDKYVAVLGELVSMKRLEDSVYKLSSFHSRHTESSGINDAAEWIYDCFITMGYTDVYYHEYTYKGITLKNIVCNKHSEENSSETIILCAHYDSREETDNPQKRAPGADDNATGVAAILEIALLLKDIKLEKNIQLVAFSGEEQGFFGSKAYAQYVQSSNMKIACLINLDMIGYPSLDNEIIIEKDMGNVSSNNNLSNKLAENMAAAAVDYTNLKVKFGAVNGSDYIPFEARGYIVAGYYESGDNPNYHKQTDTPEKVDYNYHTEVTRAALCSILNMSLSSVKEKDSGVDLYIRDNDSDTGLQPSGFPHWTSPDIWTRCNPPDDEAENPEEGHQAPINNVPNYLYVRVHNRGTLAASGYEVSTYRSNPGTGMVWPDNFELIGKISINDVIPPNGSERIGPFVWTPQIVDHECLMAVVTSNNDHSVTDYYSGKLDHSLLVRFDNNVGQRNVSPQNMVPGGKTKTSFIIRAPISSLSLDASAFPKDTSIDIRILGSIISDETSLDNLIITGQNRRWTVMNLSGEKTGTIKNPILITGDAIVTITLDFSMQAVHLKRYPLIISQECNGKITGRLTVEITAYKESEDYFYGNKRTGELHKYSCKYRQAMSIKNKIPFETLKQAKALGYDGCAFCIPEENSR